MFTEKKESRNRGLVSSTQTDATNSPRQDKVRRSQVLQPRSAKHLHAHSGTRVNKISDKAIGKEIASIKTIEDLEREVRQISFKDKKLIQPQFPEQSDVCETEQPVENDQDVQTEYQVGRLRAHIKNKSNRMEFEKVKSSFDVVFDAKVSICEPTQDQNLLKFEDTTPSHAKTQPDLDGVKSPSKMTSPEKKIYQQQLFAKDDQITEMVNQTLKKAAHCNTEMKKTIKESKNIIQRHDDAHKHFDDVVDDLIEKQIRSQQAKYARMHTVVEPNLSRRMEERKENARLRAQVREEMNTHSSNSQMPQVHLDFNSADSTKLNKMFNTCQTQLEKIDERPAKPHHTDEKLDEKRLNQEQDPTALFLSKQQNSNPQRPATTFSLQSTLQQMQMVVTPKLNEKSTVTQQAQQNVLQRQLTMQLMPCFRYRQKSAGGMKRVQPTHPVSSTPTPPIVQTSLRSALDDRHLVNNGNVLSQKKNSLQMNSIINHPSSAKPQKRNRIFEPLTQNTNSKNTSTPMPTINQIAYKSNKKQSKSKTTKQRTEQKRAASKENSTTGFRVRKVFMGTSSASKISQQRPINSANTTINLLTTSKEHKQNQHLLKQQKSQNKKREREHSSQSVKEPKIINKISHSKKEEIIRMPQVV